MRQKNCFFILTLCMGLIFAGCTSAPSVPNETFDSTPTFLEGTWRNSYGNNPVFSFVGNSFTQSNNLRHTNSGTFTFTDSAIRFRPSEGSGWTQRYTLEGNSLNLRQLEGRNSGAFIKQFEPGFANAPTLVFDTTPTFLEGTWRHPRGGNTVFIFSGNSFSQSNSLGYINSGTFTYTESTISFTTTEGDIWTQRYTLTGNRLRIRQIHGRHFGPFDKQ